jgi:aminoglycoside phosphotransferase (APT) family kinase protein
MANYAALAGEAEAELDGIDERLTDSFEEGKLEASDAELLAEIESLKGQLEAVRASLARTHSLLDATNAWLTGPNCKNAKGRDMFRKALRSDQLRIGRS